MRLPPLLKYRVSLPSMMEDQYKVSQYEADWRQREGQDLSSAHDWESKPETFLEHGSGKECVCCDA